MKKYSNEQIEKFVENFFINFIILSINDSQINYFNWLKFYYVLKLVGGGNM